MAWSGDFLIIGGGPAGSTAATLLAARGYRVMVLEKEVFPREHVGESLLPYCYPIFERLGVLSELTERFVRKPGVRFIDTDGWTQTTWCFAHVLKGPSRLSFHVIRSEFDEILLNNAAKQGATIRQGTRATAVDVDGTDGEILVRSVDLQGCEDAYRARFLLDASGRDTFMASRMRMKSPRAGLDRAALSTHWAGARYDGGIEEGLLQIVYLGGEKQGWIWAIPVGVDRVSVGVVLNHSYLRGERERLLADGSTDWQMDLYRQELFSSPFIADVLAGARTILPLMFNGDYSYEVQVKRGHNFALVGDASAFIDPIFASGVYLSMNSSCLVADALHELFTSGFRDAGPMDQAYGMINGAYALVDRAIRMFYNPTAINFAEAGSAAGLMYRYQENALSVGHFLLAGDFFEHHDRYYRFLDLLSDPQLLGLYRRAVIERPEFSAPTCDASWYEIFASVLLEHERRRAELLSHQEL
jgi:flavin-dependent dehydrogenase